MNTPDSPNKEISIPTRPSRNWLGQLMGVIIIIAAMAAGYFGYLWYDAEHRDSTAAEVSNVAAEANTSDPVAAQLKSLSDSTDTSTLKAEIADTQTGDIATELDNIDAELTGF